MRAVAVDSARTDARRGTVLNPKLTVTHAVREEDGRYEYPTGIEGIEEGGLPVQFLKEHEQMRQCCCTSRERSLKRRFYGHAKLIENVSFLIVITRAQESGMVPYSLSKAEESAEEVSRRPPVFSMSLSLSATLSQGRT